MYHYNPTQALEELQEDGLLPHPVKLRDMILRNQLGPQDAQLLNHEFQEYLTRFGELQKLGQTILEKIDRSRAWWAKSRIILPTIQMTAPAGK